MSEPTSASKARTPKIKAWGPELTDAYIGDPAIKDLLGTERHIVQFDIAAVAPTKAAAVDQYTAVGLGYLAKPRLLRQQHGNAVSVLIEAGILTNDGAVLIWHRTRNGDPIVAATPGAAPRIVAHWGGQNPERAFYPLVTAIEAEPRDPFGTSSRATASDADREQP